MNDKPDEPAGMGSEPVDSSPAQTDAGQSNQALLQALADLKAENTDLRDKHLRTMAEMENFRRRADREKSEGMKYAVSEFARDAVTIGDNLRRAIEAVQKESLDHNPALKTLLEGVEVTERELIKVFERHSISRFDPLGEKFDPHNHEAMIKVDVPNVPADIIVQVLQAGYKLNDRILRPAAVIVAKGGGSSASKDRTHAEDSASKAANAEGGNGSDPAGLQVNAARDQDPDVVREPTGAPKGAQGSGSRKERGAGDKRASTVTQPVTENSGPIKKDDLISSFGKRLENGS
jgi:molecular chaperone GrpE